MAKLVILSQSMNGRVHELKVEKTTIGRVEDNTFQIAEPSVSSHHCEVLLRGNEVVIKDLNSTNGTFINDEKISESVLKPGQTLRLGQIELRLENGAPAPAAPAAPAPTPSAAPAPAPAKKPESVTRAATRGVSLSELESGGRPPGFDTAAVFTKKRNRVGTYFWIGAVIFAVIIIVLLLYALSLANSHNSH
jgi:pSer/pThr/pTyr-binding forkhead associated (FHA) protein